MKQKYLKIGIALLAATTALVLHGQEKTVLNLGTPVRSAVFKDFVGVAGPFLNGFRPEWSFKEAGVRLYDSNGKMVRSNEVSLPGAESVSITDVAVSRGGLEAVAASAVNADGAVAALLVLFDGPGVPRVVVRTNPFVVVLVAISPDGSIWACGYDPGIEFGRPLSGPIRKERTAEDEQKRFLLQKYSPDGVLLGNFVKRTTFDEKVLPWTGLLRASASGLGLFAPHRDGSGEWVELSLNGDFKGRWILPALAEGVGMTQFSFSDAGFVYCEGHDRNNGLTPVGAYRLDKSTSTWDPVKDPDVTSPGTRLNRTEFFGTDGDLLIFRTSHSPSQVVWFQEPSK